MDTAINIDDLSNAALSKFESRSEIVSTKASAYIHQVPRRLRDVNKKAYDPEFVSIGPYHHGKDELKMMENVKVLCMQSLLRRKPNISKRIYFLAIASVEKEARDCYSGDITLNKVDFVEMLVLDACFIIQLVLGKVPDYGRQYNFGRDLILLENQIPYFVLLTLFEIIMESHKEEPNTHILLMESVLLYCVMLSPERILYNLDRSPEEVKHILDLIHTNWNPFHCDSNRYVKPGNISFTIPSATQLKDANVKFRKKKYDTDQSMFRESRGTTVFDVEFRGKSGILLMPALEVNDYTESILRNLMAFEQYYSWDKSTPVTNYALLLDMLINSSRDVQILSESGIIENMLGSDQVVADFVNRLAENITFSEVNFRYEDLFYRINVHRKKFWNRALAALHRDYLHSLWAYISIAAALVLLLLTTAQVIFSAIML